METKNIAITIEMAKCWYNSNDLNLKTLALQAFSIKELETPTSFNEMLKALKISGIQLQLKIDIEDDESLAGEIGNNIAFYTKLSIIAKYFNETWKPSINQPKFYLKEIYTDKPLPNWNKLGDNYFIGTHINKYCPDTIYFKRKEDVKKAYEIIKNDFK